MKIVCCANMPYAREAFATLGDVLVKDGRNLTADDVRDASILAIRSTAKVGRNLLAESSVKFIGTATIGFEHMDTEWLDSRGIKWRSAPGCNANSVSEYVTAALLCLADRHDVTLAGKTIGVVGVGNVGSFVVTKAQALGMRVLRNDPPRGRTEDGGRKSDIHQPSAGASSPRPRTTCDQQSATGERFVSLDEVLSESDIVTMHVPLTREGPNATCHMAGEKFFARMKAGCIFLNTARGAVVATDALLAAMDTGKVAHAVIDTWKDEPVYRKDLLDRADIGTPHIAGHSFDGKVMGTVMVYRAACNFLGVQPNWTPDKLLPPPAIPELRIDAAGLNDETVLRQIIPRVYDIEADDRRMRESCVSDDKTRAANFDLLRRNYPERREFQFTRIILKNATEKLALKVAGLGFKLAL